MKKCSGEAEEEPPAGRIDDPGVVRGGMQYLSELLPEVQPGMY